MYTMFKTVKKTIQWGGKTLTLETGKIARQAHGSVRVTYGGTEVLCAVTAAQMPNPDIDFFPLTVQYQERYYSSGRIPGGYFRREARPNEKETLISRLIDRPIRPLFHPRFKNETQVIITVVGHDLENEADVPALIGASAALRISGIPLLQSIAAARVGYNKKSGEYILNPLLSQMDSLDLDLVVAGTKDGVLMVESEAKELSEEVMLGAVTFGAHAYGEVIDLIEDLVKVAGKPLWDLEEITPWEHEAQAQIATLARNELQRAYSIQNKQNRVVSLEKIKQKTLDAIKEKYAETICCAKVKELFKALEADVVRTNLIETSRRIDGRKPDHIRPIESEVGLLKRTHGSALFTRGDTQALVVATLGTPTDEQMIDGLGGLAKESFMLHYNFPPYCVGEVRRLGAIGRREIGHGKLAWRAIHPLLETKDVFPYTIRVVSEITDSNGSSSMATVCGASMALMDAGVPLKRPCAGIAMGLIKEGDSCVILSDIMGDEDHLGDMDFKVAGTNQGITSLQMDIKITSIDKTIMRQALQQAKVGREHILENMDRVINKARNTLSEFAPKIETLTIDKDKIRDVIGQGGKVIREITETTDTKIDIEDDGTVRVAGVDPVMLKRAVDRIKDIVSEPEVGLIYKGIVAKCLEFGAFVTFMHNRDGLVHISELQAKRTAKTTDVINEGDEVFVECLGIDNRGKVKLSMRNIDQKTGKLLNKK